MSFYDDASLILIPSGYKTSKLYSAKPTDGSGDLTFTRTGSTATRVNSAGLIEECRTNQALYSEDFTNASWTKQAGNTISSNSINSPIGTLTADTINASNGLALNVSEGLTATASAPFIYSLYLKKNNLSQVNIYIYTTTFLSNALVDLDAGTITDINGSGSKIENVGNGWYRASIIGSLTSGASFFIGLLSADTSGIRSVYVWGAQLEIGDIATAYIPTTSAAVTVGPVANLPRLDYTGGGCPKLLMEPTRTNVQLYSEAFDNSAWTKTGSTVSGNVIVSPDGYTNADKLNETSTNDYHQIGATRTVSAVAHTMSVFAKKGERNFVRLYEDSTNAGAYFNLNTGAIGTITGGASAKIENYGNGWYRCIVTYTETGTTGRYRIALASADNIATYQGTAGNGIYIYGAQYEAGSYATSYIPTWNASVTRNADTSTTTGLSSLIGQTEGTIFLDVDTISGSSVGDYRTLIQIFGNATNRIGIGIEINTTNIFAYINANGSVLFPIITRSAGNYKIALGYKSGDIVMYINGVNVYQSSNALTFGATFGTLYLNTYAGAEIGSFKTSKSLLFKTRLSNTDLATLTTL